MRIALPRIRDFSSRRPDFPVGLPRFARALRFPVFGLLLMLAALCAQAQPGDFDASLDTARLLIDKARKVLDDPPNDAADLLPLRTEVLGAGAQAEAAAALLEPQLASVQARLAELGPVTPGQAEAHDVAVLRSQLNKNRAELDAQFKRAKLLAVESEQTAGEISALRRSEFQARLGERTSSILSSLFWSELRMDLPADAQNARRLFDQLVMAARASGAWVWSSVGLIGLVLLGLHLWAGHAFLGLTTTRVPPGRLRRSLHAWTRVLLPTATAGLMAEAAYLGLVWVAPLPEALAPLMSRLAGVICFGGYVVGLGHALLLPARPSWRLLPLPDVLALRLRWLPPLLALLMVLTWALIPLTAQINASLVTTVALDCIVALAMALAMGLGLLQSNLARRKALREPGSAAAWPPSPLWLTSVIGLAWLGAAVSFLALLLGYVALGSFLVHQMAWMTIVLGSAYLLAVLVDDGFTTLLSPPAGAVGPAEGAGAAAEQPASPFFKVRRQAAVLLSGVGRLLVVVLTLMLLLAPFGEGPSELFQRADKLHQGVSIGEFQIRPMSVLQALVVIGLCLVVVRIVRRWLKEDYLPTTSLDTGMQAWTATLFAYAGNLLALSLGLAAVGIGLERIAWVASALSVGIGFGLQAVVQNFVSGLIMLAEKPVKVGDWVSLGGIEGDIRRINVRATEIQMGDRSTVIVPNSEFITKTVRNVTHANPLGLVKILLPVPLAADADQVRCLVLKIFEAHADVLKAPEPGVQLDSIDSAGMVFNATAFVNSPRMAYGVRSALMFDVLRGLREAGISLVKPDGLVLREATERAPEPPAP
ncbi:MAG: mechanosensitive ion channel family protein [Burkholderiales bacterium]|nr:mechanosensitive ion channel family protein [Burkholderiales bacterium]